MITKAMPIAVLNGARGQQVLYPARFNLFACELGIALIVAILRAIIIAAKTMVNAVTCIVSSLLS